jgi:hypothetical protein
MKLSHLQYTQRKRPGTNSHITKTRYQLPQVKATIEPVAKLGEVPVKVFLTVYALGLTATYGWGYSEQTSIK